MTSSFPSVSQISARFENPDPAKLAAGKKSRQDILDERLLIRPNASSSPYEAEVSQPSRPEVPPRPARRREARENPSMPETILPPSPQDSTITVSSRHRDPPTSEAEVAVLRNEISGIKVEVQGLKEQLRIRNEEFESLNERLRDKEHRYEEAIVDRQRSRDEKQGWKDIMDTLRGELNATRNARDVAEARLATKQRELVEALEELRVSEEQRIGEARWVEARVREDETRANASRRAEEARRVEARAMEDEIRANASRRVEEARRVEARAREDEARAEASRRAEDEAARRTTEQRLIEDARREGRREGRRERRKSKVTLVVNERPKSSVAWSLVSGWTTRT